MAGHGEKLPRKQEQAIVALLEHPTVEAAAVAVQVSEKTLREWMKLQEFRDAYRDARGQLLERVVGRLLKLSGKAIDTLSSNMDASNPQASNTAAGKVLDLVLKGSEQLNLVERVNELEQLLREIQGERKESDRQAAG